ncbi:MAG: methyltransferase domain-containing protein [Dehalococcoidia bacterium]|nr:MAG: methyltransferase domain-containing protein [Dehalococcoidia bacterium]
MKEEHRSEAQEVLPVSRTKTEARHYYDRISRIYEYLTLAFERKFAEMALERLSVEEGDTVLEIGFGSGYCLQRIARSAGEGGRVYGIDISSGMIAVTRRKLSRAGLEGRVCLMQGDAENLPYSDNAFDAVFMSYTLELFDTPEIPRVLEEVKRVLRPGGRLAAASMSREGGGSLMLRLYEWAHTRWPKQADCRPIYVEKSLSDAGFEIETKSIFKKYGLPNEIVVAMKS